MKLEIAAPLIRVYQSNMPPAAKSGATIITAPAGVDKAATATASAEYNRNSANSGDPAAEPTPLDRADEIRIAAFQSLLAADPEKRHRRAGRDFKA